MCIAFSHELRLNSQEIEQLSVVPFDSVDNLSKNADLSLARVVISGGIV